jgi:hypothetical protein
MDNAQTLELFDQCDTKKRGWLTLDDLHRVCPQLADDELRYIFDTMDANRNGRIERDEFCKSFEKALIRGERRGFSDVRRRTSVKGRNKPPSLKVQSQEIVFDSEPEGPPVDITLPWSVD